MYKIERIRRTNILCPDCMKKKLLEESNQDLYCDFCGHEFYYVDKKTKTIAYK